MVTDEERLIYGVLGKIPDVIKKASSGIAKRYLDLAERAHEIAHRRNSRDKVLAARMIEREYYGLMDEAMRELDEKGIEYERIEKPR